LQKADAAGDTEAAQAIANKIKEIDASPTISPQEQVKHEELDQQIAKKTEQIEDSSSTLGALALGFGKGLTASNADEIAGMAIASRAALDHVYNSMSEEGLAGISTAASKIKEDYVSGRDYIRKAMKDLENENPWAFGAGELGGALTIGTLTSGASSLGAVGTMALEGAMFGIGSAGDKTIGEVLNPVETTKQAAISAATAPILGKAGEKLIGGTASLIGTQARKLSQFELIDYLAKSPAALKKALKNGTEYEKIADAVTEVVDYTNSKGNHILTKDMTDDIAIDSLYKYGKEISEELDNKFYTPSKDVKVDTQTFLNRIRATAKDLLRLDNDSPDAIKQAYATINSGLKNAFEETVEVKVPVSALDDTGGIFTRDVKDQVVKEVRVKNEFISLSKLNDHKAAMYDMYETATGKEKSLYANIGEKIKEIMDEAISKHTGAEGLAEFKALNDKYHKTLSIKKTLTDAATFRDSPWSFNKLFQSAFSKNSIAVAGMGALVGSAGGPLGAVTVGTIAGLSAIASNKSINKKLGFNLHNLANSIRNNPKKYAGLAHRIAVAAEGTSQTFTETVLNGIAEVDLMDKPLARNSEELMVRRSSFMTMVRKASPSKAQAFVEALDEGDANRIASLISNSPELEKFFQGGIGFDGKAVSQKDIQQVNSYLSSIKNSRKRMMLTTQFNKDNMIPKEMFMEQEPDPVNVFIYKKAKEKIRNPEY